MFGVWVGVSYFARLVPEVEALNLPFVFRSYDDIWRTVDGPVGKLIQSKVEAKGFVVLAWMELGARNVENARHPVKTLDDFEGLRIWTSPAETFQATFRALGATPRITATNEINDLIDHDNLDGVELPYSLMTGNKHYQKTKYVSDTNHVLDLIAVVTSRNTLAGMTPEQQKIIRDVAKLAAVRQRRMSEDADAAALQFLKDSGQQFDPVSPELHAAMRAATAGVVANLRASIGADLVDRAIAEADRRTASVVIRKKP
jgi:TRAP-type C4-dicarboxylate transport system substrate-binding protein